MMSPGPDPAAPGPAFASAAELVRWLGQGGDGARSWLSLAGTPPAWARWAAAAADPARVTEILRAHAEAQLALWHSMLEGRAPAGALADRRLRGEAWSESPYFDWLRRAYLVAVEHAEKLVEAARLEATERERLRFAARQWLDAASPANFIATNPEALRAAAASGGESLVRGLANLLGDLGRGRILQSDERAFEIGRNLAVTPGAVVHEGPLFQLIQYAPATAKVAKRPLVMVPPCINKFYILDLQPQNSFVRHAVAAGNTVFMLSWRNPGAGLGHLGWDDYLDAVAEALAVSREIAGGDRVNALGFCVGGTLLGAAAALAAGRGEAAPASLTFLAAMHDFADAGAIGLFVDEAAVRAREAAIGGGGLLRGAELAAVFSSLRANELVWSYVEGNYLHGRTPPAFDLLYWNADSTNLPGPMYCAYVRGMYLENRLRRPGGLASRGTPIDLGRIDCPAFFVATREDHIVPWRTAYASTALFRGENTFVLGASGHIAGIINPPAAQRRSHWRGPLADGAGRWLAGAAEHAGSWWPAWSAWLAAHGGGERKAPARPGHRKYKAIEPAPGRYVMERAA